MIVCPNCRNANEEDQAYCSRCGTSLDPGPAALLPRREREARPAIEIPPPPQPSKWRALFILGVAGALLIASGIFLLFKPNPCKGTNFASDNFGYCLEIPQGWTAEPAVFGGGTTLDQFSPARDSATVLVEAHDLTTGADLSEWAEFVRQKEQDAGLIPGDASELTVDGAAAEQWDVSATSDAGDTYQMRDVVVVHDDVGWRMTLNGTAATFDQTSGQFRRMLQSWRFR
jgi:hypothetical protein